MSKEPSPLAGVATRPSSRTLPCSASASKEQSPSAGIALRAGRAQARPRVRIERTRPFRRHNVRLEPSRKNEALSLALFLAAQASITPLYPVSKEQSPLVGVAAWPRRPPCKRGRNRKNKAPSLALLVSSSTGPAAVVERTKPMEWRMRRKNKALSLAFFFARPVTAWPGGLTIERTKPSRWHCFAGTRM